LQASIKYVTDNMRVTKLTAAYIYTTRRIPDSDQAS